MDTTSFAIGLALSEEKGATINPYGGTWYLSYVSSESGGYYTVAERISAIALSGGISAFLSPTKLKEWAAKGSNVLIFYNIDDKKHEVGEKFKPTSPTPWL